MMKIIAYVAILVPNLFFVIKKTGNPISNAIAKNISCRLVMLKATFVLTLDKSLGTGTYAIAVLLSTFWFNEQQKYFGIFTKPLFSDIICSVIALQKPVRSVTGVVSAETTFIYS